MTKKHTRRRPPSRRASVRVRARPTPTYTSWHIIEDISVQGPPPPALSLHWVLASTPTLSFPTPAVEAYTRAQWVYARSSTCLNHRVWKCAKSLCRIHPFLKSSPDQKHNYNYTFLNIYELLQHAFPTKGVPLILALDVSNTYGNTDTEAFYQRRLGIYVDAIQTFRLRQNRHTVNTFRIRYLTHGDFDDRTPSATALHNLLEDIKGQVHFILMTGTEEYFLLKQIRAYTELVNLPIFFVQVYAVLYSQIVGGNAILFINSAYQPVTQQLLYLLASHYASARLVKHDDTALSNYVCLSGFRGIDNQRLSELVTALTQLNKAYPHLGHSMNIHDPAVRARDCVTKPVHKQTDIVRFPTQLLSAPLPRDFVDRLKTFATRTVERMRHKQAIVQHIERALIQRDHGNEMLQRIHTAVKDEARAHIRSLGFVYEPSDTVADVFANLNEFDSSNSKARGGIFDDAAVDESPVHEGVSTLGVRSHGLAFRYTLPYFVISSRSVANEIRRFELLQQWKTQVNEAFRAHALSDHRGHPLTFGHMFPQWIMNQVKHSGDADPLLPSAKRAPFDHTQLREDIVALANVTEARANEFIHSLKLEATCEAMIHALHEHQREAPPTVRVTTFDYQLHGLHYVKFHASLDHPERHETTDFVFSLTRKRYDFLFEHYKRRHALGHDAPMQTDFKEKCFLLILRYYTLESYNQQLAVSPAFYQRMQQQYNVRMELFASSLNTSLSHYCSLFPDVESDFNSRGRFDFLQVRKGMYSANPPFSVNIMDRMVDRFHEWFAQTTDDLGIVITIPAWDKDEDKYGAYTPLVKLRKSPHLVECVCIPKHRSVFFDYLRNKRITPCDVYVLLLQNKASRAKYPLPLKTEIQRYWK